MRRAPPVLLSSVLIAFAALGCAGEPRIKLLLCGDWAVPEELDAVRVSTLSNDRAVETYAGVFELATCGPNAQTQARALPTEVAFAAPASPMWVVVQGLRDSAEVTRVELRIGNPVDGDIDVNVRLTSNCGRVECPLGQTCIDGECVIAPYWETDPMSCADAAPPTDADTWGADAGDAADAADGSDSGGGPDAADAADSGDVRAEIDAAPESVGPVPTGTAPTGPCAE